MNEVEQAASLLGKLGRKRNSPAQAEASRNNGKRGGYPKGKPRIRISTEKKSVAIPERSG